MSLITALEAHDIRFPTSRDLDGSDAMNPDPDYSAAYVRLRTDAPSGLCGHGFVFTIGRGNDVQTTAFGALGHLVVGRQVEEVLADLGAFARSLTADSQLRSARGERRRYQALTRGRRILNLAPPPGAPSISIAPWCCRSIMLSAIASPSPVPPVERLREDSAR